MADAQGLLPDPTDTGGVDDANEWFYLRINIIEWMWNPDPGILGVCQLDPHYLPLSSIDTPFFKVKGRNVANRLIRLFGKSHQAEQIEELVGKCVIEFYAQAAEPLDEDDRPLIDQKVKECSTCVDFRALVPLSGPCLHRQAKGWLDEIEASRRPDPDQLGRMLATANVDADQWFYLQFNKVSRIYHCLGEYDPETWTFYRIRGQAAAERLLRMFREQYRDLIEAYAADTGARVDYYPISSDWSFAIRAATDFTEVRRAIINSDLQRLSRGNCAIDGPLHASPESFFAQATAWLPVVQSPNFPDVGNDRDEQYDEWQFSKTVHVTREALQDAIETGNLLGTILGTAGEATSIAAMENAAPAVSVAESQKNGRRSDEPTPADVNLGRAVLRGMVTANPSIPAFRTAARQAGMKGSNAKLGKVLHALQSEKIGKS